MPGNRAFLSVVLPCRNQEDHIEGVLEAWFPPLAGTGKECELVAVPNACTDGTPAVVRRVAARHPDMRVVENPAGGWGLSVLTGLKAATGEVLCYANSARTDPAVIGPLLALYEENAPCLAKVRREERGALLREAGSWLYNLEARVLFGVGTRDVNGTPKMFPRTLLEVMPLESPDDLLDLELMVRVARMGMPVVELPRKGFARHGGASTTSFASAWRMYSGALFIRSRLARSRAGHAGAPLA